MTITNLKRVTSNISIEISYNACYMITIEGKEYLIQIQTCNWAGKEFDDIGVYMPRPEGYVLKKGENGIHAKDIDYIRCDEPKERIEEIQEEFESLLNGNNVSSLLQYYTYEEGREGTRGASDAANIADNIHYQMEELLSHSIFQYKNKKEGEAEELEDTSETMENTCYHSPYN